MSNQIETMSISELLGMNFYIPNYQRGYRWTRQQVKDLLDDIDEFIDKKDPEGFYCIQPLVVKKNIKEDKKSEFKEKLKSLGTSSNPIEETENILKEFTLWEVIDGQQRLTTIYILLSFLEQKEKYSIEYETRPESKDFLNKIFDIQTDEKTKYIDFFYMNEAKNQIKEWFIKTDNEFKVKFTQTILKNVKFIWYESVDEDSIKVFTRLNIGKISLTNAELIKALFLNRSNFSGHDYEKLRLRQQEIASEWDTIEYTLQSEEFWLFLNKLDYAKPTRIDFIFDIISEKNKLSLTEDEKINIGTDSYRTFRYFYTWFRKNKGNYVVITKYWKEIKAIFQIFQEWYNDLELYHYIGFLIIYNVKIDVILSEWETKGRSKENFLEQYIIPTIKKYISKCTDLNKQYETNNNPKTECRPILLLHNIQTIINQNKSLKDNEKYKIPVFYKFPFHLYKLENWDVEHIDSHTENPLENENDQKEWSKYSLHYIDDQTEINDGKKLKDEINKFLVDQDDKLNFETLWNGIHDSEVLNDKKLINEEKDRLWNFALLDASTNRGYGNDIFAFKRKKIIEKDMGQYFDYTKGENQVAIAFIPPCTKNVFLKYYNSSTNSLREWDKDDAVSYRKNIESVLEKFLRNNEESKNEQL